MNVDFRVEKLADCDLPVEVKDAFYRIAQEGVEQYLQTRGCQPGMFLFPIARRRLFS